MGRPSKMGEHRARVTVVEAVLGGKSLDEAAAGVGATVRAINRYMASNPWFRDVVEAARAGGERALLLEHCEAWDTLEPGSQPPVLPPTPAPAEPEPQHPEPIVVDVAPEPAPGPPPIDVEALQPVARRAVEPGVPKPEPAAEAAVVAAVLGVDADLVADVDLDLNGEVVSFPASHADPNAKPLTMATFVSELWTAAQNPADPRATTAMRILDRALLRPVVRAQARREGAEARRQELLDAAAITTEGTAVEHDQGPEYSGLVILEIPAKEAVI
jgi:hypothetical protein